MPLDESTLYALNSLAEDTSNPIASLIAKALLTIIQDAKSTKPAARMNTGATPPTYGPLPTPVAAPDVIMNKMVKLLREKEEQRLHESTAMAKAVAKANAAHAAPPSHTMEPRGPHGDNADLYQFLCNAVGATEEQFIKYDGMRGVIDPDPSVDSLKVLVDLTELMAIPGSGFEFCAYWYRSPEGVRLRAAKKAMITAADEIQLLGGPGVASDTAVQAFYDAKAAYTVAQSKMLQYNPHEVPVPVPEPRPEPVPVQFPT